MPNHRDHDIPKRSAAQHARCTRSPSESSPVIESLGGKPAEKSNGFIVGPKACGKSETARRQAASEVLLDIDLAAREAAAIDPGLVLSGRLGEGSTGQCCL
jgi:hypothetical protein